MLTALLNLYTSGTLLASNPANSPVNNWKNEIVLEASAIPKLIPENLSPVLKGKSVYAVDAKTGQALFEKNIYDQRPIASITKLMTMIIILEENNLDEVVTVSKKAAQTTGSKIWLAPDEKITVRDLIYASLIHSANDAAYALAEYNTPNVQDFIAKMNQKARELGLENTHFTNPVGFDDDENYSTAHDLVTLARYAYSKDFIRKAAVMKSMEITSTNGKLKHKLTTTNDLLDSYLDVKGLKTGTTDLAGQCLIGIINSDNGNEIITVMLDSPSRYQETKVLTDWVFRTFKWTS